MCENISLVSLLYRYAGKKGITLGTVHYPAKKILMKQGDALCGVHIILSGLVSSSMMAENGKEIVTAVMGSGEVIGELEYLLEIPLVCTVCSVEPVDSLYISYEMMNTLFADSAVLVAAFARHLAGKLYKSSLRVQSTLVFPLEYNLLKIVLNRFEASGASGVPIKPLSKQDLLEYLGGTERHLNRKISELVAAGVLVLEGKMIVGINRGKACRMMKEIEDGRTGERKQN